MRRTKIVCTIGPGTCDYESVKKLAATGMNVARLNMSHGDHEWHGDVIKAVKRLNQKTNYSVAIMLDTKGPEIRSGDLRHELEVKSGDKFTFSTESKAEYGDACTSVNYDGFPDDVNIGDIILVDGGLLSFEVVEVVKKNVICKCIDGGTFASRRHLNIRGKSAKLPSITDKDWDDINFGIEQGVDFIALSFVKDEKVVKKLKDFLKEGNHAIDVIPKIECADASKHLEAIVRESDGLMVARGDLGSELPVEDVPLLQEEMVYLCRKYRKPVIVATHLLESMIVNPTPTRAEVTDIANAVRERADAIMLSGESAIGKHPYKAVDVMDRVSRKIEESQFKKDSEMEIWEANTAKEEIAKSAAIMANNLKADSIWVFTRSGSMAGIVSQFRPNSKIFAFTNTSHVRRKLNLMWGVNSFRIDFSNDPEKTIKKALSVLKERKLISPGGKIITVSDILVDKEFVNSVQIREV